MAMEDDRELVEELEALLEGNPDYRAARQKHHCSEGSILYWGPDHFRNISSDSFDQEAVMKVLSNPEEKARILIYQTSDTTPEPLAGSGILYAFVFHPTEPMFITAGTGDWRS